MYIYAAARTVHHHGGSPAAVHRNIIFDYTMCRGQTDQLPAGSGSCSGGRARCRVVPERWLYVIWGGCRTTYIPISIVTRGHFIVVTAAPDFRGARPARRVFIGRHADDTSAATAHEIFYIYIYMDACTPVGPSRLLVAKGYAPHYSHLKYKSLSLALLALVIRHSARLAFLLVLDLLVTCCTAIPTRNITKSVSRVQ